MHAAELQRTESGITSTVLQFYQKYAQLQEAQRLQAYVEGSSAVDRLLGGGTDTSISAIYDAASSLVEKIPALEAE